MAKANKSNKKTNKSNKKTKSVETVENVLDAIESPIEGLETTDEIDVVPTGDVNFSDIEFLTNNEPDFTNTEFTSSKYDEDREPKVQNGLAIILALVGDKIDPLVILLAKWWEVKPARAAIKKMIDEAAEAKGIFPPQYLQVDLRANVDSLSEIQQATNRMKYAINYFKPRKGITPKETYKTMLVDGETYKVGINQFAEMKTEFGEDKKGLKAAVIETFEKIVMEEL